MTDRPLYISFLWHMHQPYYKDPFTGVYRLPWVRLHGTKDYLDMVEILAEFPGIKQTFNFTPSLLDQLLDYTENNAKDHFLELTLKKASELNIQERQLLIENFFLANWNNMIKPFPRYYELLKKRGLHLVQSELMKVAKYFNDSDFLDLQVLFNLCWIDPLFREKDPFLSMLVDKGRDFTEEEKNLLISKQLSIMKQIIPRYREIAEKGQIELSVSPYYHPILPLLCDTNIAKVSMPDIKLPQKRFSYPEDAETQIKMGLDYFEKIFGYRPVGMWPSEGSVSEDVLRIVSKEGIKWVGTDEDVLSVSSGEQIRDSSRDIIEPSVLYKPYIFENVSIIFRDHILSDLIGFEYSNWDAKKSAEDLINRLLKIREVIAEDMPHLVSLILDGENAWEYYKNDGNDFIRYLYEGLSREKRLKTVTVTEYLTEFDKGKPLTRLHPGSWINSNFSVWIGHEEDNTAWDYLKETREELELFQKMSPEKDLYEAWKAIYIAEGSDWNWWYGDEHTTENQKDFDELFRLNLMKVYKETGKDVPRHLLIPVLREDRSVSPTVTIRGFIEPEIDGVVTSYYEWYQGAYIDIKKFGGSMHKAESILSGLYYGFNKDELFLRLDPLIPFGEIKNDIIFCINLIKPSLLKVIISIRPSVKAELLIKDTSGWKKLKDINDVAIKDIFEIAMPFRDLQVKEKDEIYLNVSIIKNGEEIEKCPCRGYVSITVPTPDFEAMMWY
ncbi:MAG: glycoside hydrolase family 57 [Nitrospirae bacterium]|jgi:alpha-amylase/alpha-mannosidase (GH57 family)|nr:glycoside hydrolase family 57 [Nitrospirota bacterium]